MKTSRASIPFIVVFMILCASTAFANGVLIFGSWDTSAKATKDAERISGILEQKATTMEATVKGRNVYRVVISVATADERSALAKTAQERNLDSWFLATEKLAQTDSPSTTSKVTPVADDAGVVQSSDAEEFVLSVSDVDPEAVLSYLDKATINSTISKLDAVRKRAQELIPDFEPRTIEQPSIDRTPETPKAEDVQEEGLQMESSTTEQS